MSYHPSLSLCWQAFPVAILFLSTPLLAEPLYGSRLLEHAQNFRQYPAAATASHADGVVVAPFPPFSGNVPDDLVAFAAPVTLVSNETKPQEPDTDIFALMSGKCTTLAIAGRDFGCRSVAFFHSGQGRTNFTIALDDPTDDSHIISFSGENGRREDNLYELPIDRMLLNSKDRPKVDGLPVPFAELSTGICTQLGNFANAQVSTISCTAIDKKGNRYELHFESDGSPITVRRVRQYPLSAVKHRAKQAEQLECRYKADLARILPRDRTAFIIECLAEDSEKPTPAAQQ